MRVLVTGGAGYVGSVSAEALVAAGHDVVVLDDLSTGHRAAAPPEAHADRRQLRRRRVHRGPAATRRDRGDPPLRGALAGRRIGPRARPGTTATTWPAASPCSRPRGRPAWGGSCSRRPRRSTASPTPRPSRRTRRSGRSTLRRDEADVRGRAALVRRGVRAAERGPALLQRRGATERLGEDPRPRDAPHPERAAAPPEGAAADAVRRRLPDAGRDVRSATTSTSPTWRMRTSAALEATAAGRRRGPPEPLICNLGSGGGFCVREVLAPRSASSGRPVPHRVGPRRAGDPPVLVATNRRAADVLGWAPGTLHARRDDRLRVGLATGAPERLRRLSDARERPRAARGRLRGAARACTARARAAHPRDPPRGPAR